MKRAKGLVVGLAALWLAGCASTSSETDNMGEGVMTPGGTDSAAVTVPLNDPVVKAVIDSGKVIGSPEQIAAYLRDDTVNFNYDSDRLSADDAAMLDVQAAYLTSPEGLSPYLQSGTGRAARTGREELFGFERGCTFANRSSELRFRKATESCP